MTNHRLVGFLRIEDGCYQPVLEERWIQKVSQFAHGHRGTYLKDFIEECADIIWEGTFLSDPSPSEISMLEEELAEAAHRHHLEREWGAEEVWYEKTI